jgi:hypothetical protein
VDEWIPAFAGMTEKERGTKADIRRMCDYHALPREEVFVAVVDGP